MDDALRKSRAQKNIDENVAHDYAPYRNQRQDLPNDIARSMYSGRDFIGV